MVAASIGIVRVPLPGTAMGRGVKGHGSCRSSSRARSRRGAGRRATTSSPISATRRNDAGELLTDQEIIDHMNFLMMAAHDTLTSSLTSTLYHLASYPEWQERLRTEISRSAPTPGRRCRSTASATSSRPNGRSRRRCACSRRCRRSRAGRCATSTSKARIPGGTHVGVNPMYTHRMPEYWEDPETFDPSRFSHNRSKGRHKYAWVPFGGGAHMCIGLHFAYMQMKAFFYTLLREYRVTVPAAIPATSQMFPIPKPKDGLPIRLERLYGAALGAGHGSSPRLPGCWPQRGSSCAFPTSRSPTLRAKYGCPRRSLSRSCRG